jgi:hypothetical protein
MGVGIIEIVIIGAVTAGIIGYVICSSAKKG